MFGLRLFILGSNFRCSGFSYFIVQYQFGTEEVFDGFLTAEATHTQDNAKSTGNYYGFRT